VSASPQQPAGGDLGRWLGRYALLLILLSGLAFRIWLAFVVLPGQGFGGDLTDHVQWMRKLVETGPGGYYAAFHDRVLPPGWLWILWVLGSIAQAVSGPLAGPDSAWFALVKLPAIVADVAIAALLFVAVRSWTGRRAALTAAALFLWIPVTWYESAIWGQIDSIGALLMLVALVLLIAGVGEGAAAAGAAAAIVKPQFGIILFVVAIVLLRRHAIMGRKGAARTDAPIPGRGPLRGWFSRQGPERLVSAGVAALVVGLALIVPFGMRSFATGALARIPLVGDIAGLVSLFQAEANMGNFRKVTVNAFNPWAFVGNPPLVTAVAHWTDDSIKIIGGLGAFTVGALLLAIAFAVVGFVLLRRDDRTTLLVATAVLVLAFFVLPTRVHERYGFPAFALMVPLAVTSVRWRTAYLILAAASLVNLHAILSFPGGLYGTSAIVGLPLGGDFRSPILVGLSAITTTAVFGWSVWQLRSVFEPAARRIREVIRRIDERWPLRNLIPDAGTALLIVLAASLLLRAAWLSLPQNALIFDEAYYVQAARLIAGIHPPTGAHYADAPLYLDPNTEHPPLGKALIAASILFFGDNGVGWRVPSVVAGMLALVAVYGIVRALHGRAWMAVLATGLYSLDVLSFIHGRIGTLDMMSLGFLLLGAWLALRKDWILAGAALALGTLVKVPGVYGFGAVFVWQAWALWRTRRTRALTRDDFVPLAALTGAYAFVGFAGLWLLDLRFTTYTTPLDHINRMVGYGFALQGSPSGIASAPWQWLVNDGQFDYLKTSVNTLVNGVVVGSRTTVQFRAMLNPVLIGTAWIGVLYAAWLAWRRGEPVASFGLLWIVANYLPFWPLFVFSHRISYFYYLVPAVPGLALVLAAVLVHARVPRAVTIGFVAMTALLFFANFPFKEIPG
jgi:4-amino-4-deoxy-L-arabinose transferase-like glycosyltransferase